jgi:hypothetical protein
MEPQTFPGKSKQKVNYFIDRFEMDRPAGTVIGSKVSTGILRQGIDEERVIGIDNGALRIEPLVHEGWGQAVIAYGPYARESGLTFAVSLTNGHNTSQAGNLTMSFKRRMYEWAMGSHAWPFRTRLSQWIRYNRKKRTIRLWRRWWANHNKYKKSNVAPLDENLVLGWFPNKILQDPRTEGNAFIVHATGAENGELWVRTADGTPPLIRGLQNIPLYYLIVLREQGAAYYAAAVPDTPYLPAYPRIRPLAIDPFNQDPAVYAGLFQGVSGQIGFRADTRVREVQVTKVQKLSAWYGTAQAADRLQGEGPLAGSSPEKGGLWAVPAGGFERTGQGCRPAGEDNLAIMQTESPAGLLHVLVRVEEAFSGSLRLVWRWQDPQNYWAWEVGESGSRLMITFAGETAVLAHEGHPPLATHSLNSLQALDDGVGVHLYLNGVRVCSGRTVDPRLQDQSGVGIACRGEASGLRFSMLEVHPRDLPVPEEIELCSPWTPSRNRIVVAEDDFGGPAGDLAGRATPVGGCVWERAIGSGRVELAGDGCAVVRGSLQQPNPGRTAYLIPWDVPGNADLELDFTPPGTGPGQWEKSRAGLIFYQDPDNYITVSTFLDDYYDGSSFAFFYHLNGFEEIYDAIWSNVGRKITWGIPVTARVIIEGVNLAVYINGEAVLYRSLTDVYPDVHQFKVRRVGVVVNWEWGDDTGTRLNKFSAASNNGGSTAQAGGG